MKDKIQMPWDDPNRKPDLVFRNGDVVGRIYHINPEAIPAAMSRMVNKGFELFMSDFEWQEIAAKREREQQKQAG